MKLRLLLVSILLIFSVAIIKMCGEHEVISQKDILVTDSIAVKSNFLIDSVSA